MEFEYSVDIPNDLFNKSLSWSFCTLTMASSAYSLKGCERQSRSVLASACFCGSRVAETLFRTCLPAWAGRQECGQTRLFIPLGDRRSSETLTSKRSTREKADGVHHRRLLRSASRQGSYRHWRFPSQVADTTSEWHSLCPGCDNSDLHRLCAKKVLAIIAGEPAQANPSPRPSSRFRPSDIETQPCLTGRGCARPFKRSITLAFPAPLRAGSPHHHPPRAERAWGAYFGARTRIRHAQLCCCPSLDHV